jgi:hypothetical protein
MPGRTVERWLRFYMDGYDMSGYARTVGALAWKFDEADLTAIADNVKGRLPVQCEMSPTSLDGNFDTTATSGLHVIASAPGVSRVCMIPIGINAEPVQGDWAYCGRYQQSGYTANNNSGAMVVNIPFEGWDAAYAIGYDIPWGQVLHAKGAETAANTAAGVESLTAAATVYGGYLVYQVFAGNGTETISVDKSTTTNINASFSALSGATSGEIDFSNPTAGIIALSKSTSIGRYLRWQLSLNSATSVTFALAFVRAYHS